VELLVGCPYRETTNRRPPRFPADVLIFVGSDEKDWNRLALVSSETFQFKATNPQFANTELQV
jgi:hypothetical protein